MAGLQQFEEVDAPQNLVVSATISTVINILLFLANLFFLAKVSFAYARIDREKHKAVIRLLMGQLAFTAITCGMLSIVLATKTSVEACFYLASAAPFAYCMSFAFSYLVLLNRAKAVNEWEQTKCFNALYNSITVAVYSLGLFSICACFLLYGKTLFKQHYCALVPISPAIVWIMLLLDSLLSFTLYVLFAVPMLARLRLSQTRLNELDGLDVDDETQILRKAARRNFWLSSVQIMSTFIALLITFFATFTVNTSTDPELQVLNMVTIYIGPIDTSINAACSLAMVHKVWRRKSKNQVAPRSGGSRLTRLSRNTKPSAG